MVEDRPRPRQAYSGNEFPATGWRGGESKLDHAIIGIGNRKLDLSGDDVVLSFNYFGVQQYRYTIRK